MPESPKSGWRHYGRCPRKRIKRITRCRFEQLGKCEYRCWDRTLRRSERRTEVHSERWFRARSAPRAPWSSVAPPLPGPGSSCGSLARSRRQLHVGRHGFRPLRCQVYSTIKLATTPGRRCLVPFAVPSLSMLVVAVSALAFLVSTGVGVVWPLAWLAPIPVLVLAVHRSGRTAAFVAFSASLLGDLSLARTYGRVPCSSSASLRRSH
jgi:hypothetical protein